MKLLNLTENGVESNVLRSLPDEVLNLHAPAPPDSVCRNRIRGILWLFSPPISVHLEAYIALHREAYFSNATHRLTTPSSLFAAN